ncbi:hypothetical protein CPLU01_15765 [Colletotrichum plurivorum]|uniref:Uncharacterized protein n=1 Tax=Colletotrichum plurivorum TaxID=2175906 RepID=A0A8H6MSS3_9PEZI|nr:hypothetical protein CPLU01_15765 [Colletotrichum plurivorum]
MIPCPVDHARKVQWAPQPREALGQTSTIALILRIGPDAVTYTKAVPGVSPLRIPTSHEPVTTGDPALVSAKGNFINVVTVLKTATSPKAAAAEKRTRKPKSETAEVEETRRKRRCVTIDRDVQEAMGDQYVSKILNDNEPTILSNIFLGDERMRFDLGRVEPLPDDVHRMSERHN